MSRIRRAQELAKQVLGTNRASRNQQYIRNIPQNRARNLAEQVLKTPITRPGGLVAAGQAMKNAARSDAVGRSAGAIIATGGTVALSQTDPNDLGRQLAKIDQPFYELIGKVQESASDIAQIPQVYFMQVKQAYDDERQKQQELQNIQEFGNPMGAPEEILESGEIKPVSLFFAQGGPAMSDNEPRMEDRDQVFSIEADIQNLMKSYNMLVEAQEFDRAQQVADQINMLDVQKTQIQAQNVPQQEDISSLLNSISI